MSEIKPIRRVSVEAGDIGARIYHALIDAEMQVKIFLDEIEQSQVITADADTGFVKRYASRDEIIDGHWPIEVIHGKVVIEISPAAHRSAA